MGAATGVPRTSNMPPPSPRAQARMHGQGTEKGEASRARRKRKRCVSLAVLGSWGDEYPEPNGRSLIFPRGCKSNAETGDVNDLLTGAAPKREHQLRLRAAVSMGQPSHWVPREPRCPVGASRTPVRRRERSNLGPQKFRPLLFKISQSVAPGLATSSAICHSRLSAVAVRGTPAAPTMPCKQMPCLRGRARVTRRSFSLHHG